jgi:hypothetical protein
MHTFIMVLYPVWSMESMNYKSNQFSSGSLGFSNFLKLNLLASFFFLFPISHVFATYTSHYPPAQSDTYVKATSSYGGYSPYFSTDPGNSLTGTWAGNQWVSGSEIADQRFNIDLGSAMRVTRIYYENSHNSGSDTITGAKQFTVQGSNDAGAFASTVYATNTNWTDITATSSALLEHTGSDVADPQYVYLTNGTSYRYYSLKLHDIWGAGSYMGLRRIELQTDDGPTPTPTPTPFPNGPAPPQTSSNEFYVDFTNSTGSGQLVHAFIHNLSSQWEITRMTVQLGGANFDVNHDNSPTIFPQAPQTDLYYTFGYTFGSNEIVIPPASVLFYVHNLVTNAVDVIAPTTTTRGVLPDAGRPIVPTSCDALDLWCQAKQWFFSLFDYWWNTVLRWLASIFSIDVNYIKARYNDLYDLTLTKVPWAYTAIITDVNLDDPPMATDSGEGIVPDINFPPIVTQMKINGSSIPLTLMPAASVSGTIWMPFATYISQFRTAVGVVLIAISAISIISLIMTIL